ncbi:UbiA family prenyltransferase [Streptomyces buecherae]|uniref:UbiA family prenyltransferase n=2 Tax=Streptomyces TaxID=1883 RepID=UPI001C25D08B|nr:UbiA family prenyltransferase [Streptomyces buecherae]
MDVSTARGAPAPLPLLVLRSCSCRFAAYYWMGFLAGLAAVDHLTVGRALAAVPMWLAFCVGTESVNRIADREADVVNRPERTALCEAIGWRRLTRIAVGAWLVFAASGAALFALDPEPAFAAMIVVDIAIAIGYSIGPAFKRHRVLALLVLVLPLILPMVTGWATAPDADALGSPVLPAAAVLATFSLGLAGIKDITDVAGDRLLGYSSLWLTVAGFGRGAAVYALVVAPFALDAVFVVLHLLPVASLAVTPCVVVSAYVVRGASAAESTEERSVAREVMHSYTFLFLAAYLLAAMASPGMAAVTALGACHWLLASRRLHWAPAITRAQLHRWAKTVVPSSRGGTVERV